MPFDSTPGNDVVRKQRLMELCRVIESVSEDAFDLRDWNNNGVCRTVACAVGWAMKDSWFKAEGLGYDGKSPAYEGEKGWRAVRRFFDLNRDEALYLFHAGKYDNPTRQAVVTRIREIAG